MSLNWGSLDLHEPSWRAAGKIVARAAELMTLPYESAKARIAGIICEEFRKEKADNNCDPATYITAVGHWSDCAVFSGLQCDCKRKKVPQSTKG